MLQYERYEADPDEVAGYSGQMASASAVVTARAAEVSDRSALLTAAGTIEPARPGSGLGTGGDADVDAELDSAAAALRSWVVGWTHRFDPLGARRVAEPSPAGVRRLVEAVIDVLLERRPAEQVKRWVSREVFALLTAVTQRRAASRFAARSMVRSIQLHTPGPDAVESTVLVQDGPRVRAVALRFERVSVTNGTHGMHGIGSTSGAHTSNGSTSGTHGIGGTSGAHTSSGSASGTHGISSTNGAHPISGNDGGGGQGRLEWRCTALQFA